MAASNKDLVENIPEDISFLYHPEHMHISKKARHRGLNYYLQGYIHDIQLDAQDGTLNARCKCYRSYKKNETPHTLHMEISLHNKQIVEAYCSCVAG